MILTAFLKGITTTDPQASVFNTPLYSNAAVQILAYAMEAMQLKPFAQQFKNAIATPLKLTRTFLSLPPSDANAIIPFSKAASWWAFDIGDAMP